MPSFEEYGGLRNKWDAQLFTLYGDRDAMTKENELSSESIRPEISQKSSDGSR